MSEKATRVGVLEYSKTARTWIPLSRYYDMGSFKTALLRVERTRGATYFDKPLAEALKMFSKQYGGRDEVPNVFVLFTDGKSRNEEEFEEAARALKETGTTLITVGIGKYVQSSQLERMATQGYILRVRSFSELAGMAEELASLACKDPCANTKCDFNSRCLVNKHGTTVCVCPTKCPKKVDDVCGSDGRNYENDCLLRQEACTKKKRLSVSKLGKCDLCSQKVCSHYARCALKDNGKIECVCPKLSDCPQEINPVCGGDGVTYVNDCFRRVAGCKRKQVIPLTHEGECDLCKRKKCSMHSKCYVDKRGKAKCGCPDERSCSQVADAVCGTDSVTYLNECVMKARSCRTGVWIEKKSDGSCGVCTLVKSCKYHANCVENSDKTVKCVCPVKEGCKPSTKKVCGSDDKTYASECLLKVEACKKKSPLTKRHDGPCGPCNNRQCHRYAKCEAGDDGLALCKCPDRSSCPLESDPVCGSDGQTYANECELKATACKAGKPTVPVSKGKCRLCSTKNCKDYQTCKEVNGKAVCECPTVDTCPRDVQIVCGSDGKSYLNKCRMKLESCKKKKAIVPRHEGICMPCSVSNCRNNGTCILKEDGSTACKCQLAKKCPKTRRPVCASTRQVFQNECHLRAAACKSGKPISVKNLGTCSPCAFAKCKDFKVCSQNKDRTVKCTCPKSCSDAGDLVCGSDGKTYASLCSLQKRACETKRHIAVVNKGKCNACFSVRCPSHAECFVDSNGKTSCKCKDPKKCKPVVKEVCGSDGKTYKNVCLLKAASCKAPKRIHVARKGPCGFIDDLCSLKNCKHGARCDSKGKCVCPKVDDCPPDQRSVCGSDGITYESQCHLDVTSCKKQMLLEATKGGPCDTCAKKKCLHNAKCVSMAGKPAKCKCPRLSDCSRKIELLCGKLDRDTYLNECAQKVHSCRKQKPSGMLEEDFWSVCSLVKCPYHGICSPGKDGAVNCSCIKKCPLTKDSICADDGKTYYSECAMKKTSCDKKKPLNRMHKGPCGLLSNYDLKFPGKIEDFVEFKDFPKLKEVTVAFWMKSNDKSRKGTIFSYSVPGKRNALTLADPSGFLVYVNADEKEAMHKKTPVSSNDGKWHQITLTWRNRDGSWKLFKDGKLVASAANFQKGVVIPAGGTLTLGHLQEEPGYRLEPSWAYIGELSQFNMWSKELPLSEITALASSCARGRGDVITWCDVKNLVYGQMTVITPSFCPKNKDDPCCGKTCPKPRKCTVTRDGKAVCACQRLDDCQEDHDAVCGSDKKTYGNKCLMEALACREKRPIEVAENKKCDACSSLKCDYYSTCEIGLDALPRCVCPKIQECPAVVKPVCGTNGKSYINDCRLKVDSCKKKKKIKVAKEGICDHCMFASCPFYHACQVDDLGSTRCVCPAKQKCPRGSVCADNGVTYKDECDMKAKACEKKKKIVAVHKGKCDACSGVQCDLYGICQVINASPKCTCPRLSSCPSGPPVCGDNGKSYASECHLKVESCTKSRGIYVIANGTCNPCSEKECKHHSTCEVDSTNHAVCVCPKAKCPKSRAPVCGDDGNTYDSYCALKAESCSKQKPIRLKNQGVCGIIENSCTLKSCKHHATCKKGKCSCPQKEDCPPYTRHVCASNGKIYENECVMRVDSCKMGRTLLDVGMEKCTLCLFAKCPIYGQCVVQEDGTTGCQCQDPATCPPEYNRVCATNKKTYDNECKMKADACRLDDAIGITKLGPCKKAVKFFKGTSYMRFTTPLGMKGKLTSVKFNIRPVQEDGVLLYADEKKIRDFIAVVLKNGYVEFNFDLGDGVGKLKSSLRLEMNRWYKIAVTRKEREAKLIIDDKYETTGRSPKIKFILDIGKDLYFGGLEKINARSRKKLGIDSSFVGCLKDLEISHVMYDLIFPGAHIRQQRDIVECPSDPCRTRPCENGGKCKFDVKVAETYTCSCPKGFAGRRCQARDKAMYFKGARSFAELPLFKDESKFDISVEIRPAEKDGMLLYGDGRLAEFVGIGLKDGRVLVSLDAGHGKVVATSKQPLTLQDWHTIRVRRNKRDLELTVDEQKKVTARLPKTFSEIDLDARLVLGEPKQLTRRIAARDRSTLKRAYYTGCIRTLVIDGHAVNLASENGDTLDQKGLAQCKPCVGTSCGNNGKCIPTAGNTFFCLCQPNYAGKFCEFKERQIYFKGKGSMITLPAKKEYEEYDISFDIRPQENSGPLIYAQGNRDYLSIAIKDGFVESRLDAGTGPSLARSERAIELHSWHKVRVSRDKKRMFLYVDDHKVVSDNNKGNFIKINVNAKFYLGTFYTESSQLTARMLARKRTDLGKNIQFIGCMRNLTINNKIIDLNYPGSDVIEEKLIVECTSCNPSPCKNNGKCIARPGLTYSCACSKRFTGPVCEVAGCDVGIVDLAFLLDDSSSMTSEEFNDVIKFLTYVIDAFPGISSTGTRVGVAMFGTDATISIAFDRYFQREQLIAAVKGLTRRMGKTYLGRGLQKASELFSDRYGSRVEATKILVVLTERKSLGQGEIAPAAEKLRKKNVRVIAVGVGSFVDDSQLREAAGAEDNVFRVPTFKGLEPVVAKLIPASCPRPTR